MTNIRVFEAFAGYGSQAMALKHLQDEFPDSVSFEFVGISEIEPNAIKAYVAVHGETTNYGDITKINWGANSGLRPLYILFPMPRHQQCRTAKRTCRQFRLSFLPALGVLSCH